MSYDRVNPTYYQTYQPDTPFHPGAEGWSVAPWMTWGDNPNLAGRRRLATDGLGKVVAISGLGGGGHTAIGIGADSADVKAAMDARLAEPAWLKFARLVATGACAYHGYRRNESVGWALGWGLLGSIAPVIAVPVALAQGFGKPLPAERMTSNRRRGRR